MKSNAADKAEPSPTRTLTLRDTVKNCRYCSNPIQWKKNSTGKFVPTEPAAGRDHRETCAGLSPATRISVRDKNHETRVTGFFRSVGAR